MLFRQLIQCYLKLVGLLNVNGINLIFYSEIFGLVGGLWLLLFNKSDLK